jgi:hypothetical protein
MLRWRHRFLPSRFPAAPEPWETRVLLKILLGPQGLRAGWSVLLFILLFFIFISVAGFVFFSLNLIDTNDHFTASTAL